MKRDALRDERSVMNRTCGLVTLFALLFWQSTLAAQDSSLQVCLEAAADHSAVYPTNTLSQPVRDVVAVFQLAEGESATRLKATYIAVDVGDAAPANFEITSTELDLNDQRQGTFRYSQPGDLPVGKYRIDVSADGKLWKSSEFSIAESGTPLAVRTSAELLPINAERILAYDFTIVPGAGVKLTLPGISADVEGTLHAAVTLTAAETDGKNVRIELRRNNKLMTEEWWKLDDSGLSATKRIIEGVTTELDPSQLLWKLTGEPRTDWDYEPSDNSYKQKYRQWQPATFAGPEGSLTGSVVFVRQVDGLNTTSVERHFVPGLGMVREIMVSAVGGKLVSRQEMILKSER